jgi:tetratricopeptide (TPR) repeat protein
MFRKAFVIFLVLFAGCLQSMAADPQGKLQKANQAYVSEEYAHAIELYESIIDTGYEAALLYYNLGNAYFREEKIGKAILNYERAMRLDPKNEDAQFNLRVANARIVDQITPVPVIFYKRWWSSVYNLFSTDGWAWASFVLLFFTVTGLAAFFIFRSVRNKKTALSISLLFFLLTVVSILAARETYYQRNILREAIVIVARTSVKSSPSQESLDLFFIHEGTKSQLTRELGEWYEIRLANGNVGWVQKTAIEAI